MTAPTATARVRFAPVEGAAQLFTDGLLRLPLQAARRLHAARARAAPPARRGAQARARAGDAARALSRPRPATTGDWKVPPVPEDLRAPGIEISGPCSITSMFINALNPGPEGERAEGDLDDDEDSGGHRLVDTVRAAQNRLAAVNRELAYTDAARGKEYRIAPGELPFFMHRERGLHLDEPEVTRGRPARAGGHPRHGADALLRGARPGGARAGHLLLPAQGRERGGGRLVPRSLRREPRGICRSSRTPSSAASRWSSRCRPST